MSTLPENTKRLFDDELAARYKEDAGKAKYRPSNGTEGTMFLEMWCANCANEGSHGKHHDPEHFCPILSNSFAYEVTDPKYPSEWTYDADGQPVCTAFEEPEEAARKAFETEVKEKGQLSLIDG